MTKGTECLYRKILFGFRRINILILFSIVLVNFSNAQKPEPFTMADYMGANSNIGAYDNGFLTDLSKCVKWIREYHNWGQYEAANNYYKWDNITTEPQGYTWPDHNKFMDKCQDLGINILIDVLNKPPWLVTPTLYISNDTGDGSYAVDFMEKLEFIGQLVARYGSKQIDRSLLETADKVTGLNYIKYYEDDNEPDYWWSTPHWPAENYAKYCLAAHDGTGVKTSTNFPLLGIKSVDPDAKHVMAGLAATDTVYLSNILKASNGRIPFDILNMHMYCNDQTDAYSPENEKYGFEKGFSDFFRWKKRVLLDMPVWITEFGWDTYITSYNQHSYIYASFDQQANYLLRSYLVLLKMGFEKAFMFLATDGNSQDRTQFSSSGFFKDKNTGFLKKPSFYYMVTMQNILGSTIFRKTIAYAEKSGDNEIYCFEFENPDKPEKVYAMWTRKSNSNVDNGANMDYQFDLGFTPETVYSIVPRNFDEDGDTIGVNRSGTVVNLHLTETPQFIYVSETNTGNFEQLSQKPKLNAFPNPSNGTINISYSMSVGCYVNLAVYTSNGQFIKTFIDGQAESGTMQFSFGGGFSPGVYLVRAQSTYGIEVQKIILLR